MDPGSTYKFHCRWINPHIISRGYHLVPYSYHTRQKPFGLKARINTNNMIILFILGILLGAVAVIFSLQNTAIIVVSFFSWNLTGSLALVLLMAIGSGILITLLLLLPEFISNYFRYKEIKKENSKVEEELRKQKQLTVFAYQTSPTKVQLSKIENGEIEEIGILI